MFDDVLAPNGLPDPIDDLRPSPKPLRLFLNSGLPAGEYGELPTTGLPRPDRGELA